VTVMFETHLEMDEKGMTVPYPPLFDDVRKNHGFVDIRGRPEFVSRIAESLNSLAMRKLLVELAQPNARIFWVGCDLGASLLTEKKLPHTAGGYIQLMHVSYADRSPEDYCGVCSRHCSNPEDKITEPRMVCLLRSHSSAFKLDGFSDMTGSAVDLVPCICG